MPLDDAVSEHWSSGCMFVLTSLALKLGREFFGRYLNNACLLVRGTVAIVAVVDHFEKFIEFKMNPTTYGRCFLSSYQHLG